MDFELVHTRSIFCPFLFAAAQFPTSFWLSKLQNMSLPDIEREALDDFYLTTQGEHWLLNAGWSDENSDPCSFPGWYGVKCVSPVNGSWTITGIMLKNNNVTTSQLPSSLSQLSNLTVFDLSSTFASGNNIFGTISETFCELPKLQEFNVSGHYMTGTIPSCLAGSTDLEYLDLSNNQGLTGSIDFVCSLPKLKEIAIRKHYQNSKILNDDDEEEEEENGGGVGGLNENIPDCFGSVQPKLEFVDLRGNPMKGSIPISLCDAISLETLFLDNMDLTGTIPLCSKNWNVLLDLSFAQNTLVGSIPSALCQVEKLKSLSLYENSFTGVLPGCLGLHLPSLLILNISVNQLSGSLPISICNSTQLNEFSVFNNMFTGNIPRCFGNLQSLQELELSNNRLTSTLPSELCQLRYLIDLKVDCNKFTGSIPSCYALDFTRLLTFYLHDNQLSGPIPPHWTLASLSTLILSNNKELSGEMPDSVFFQFDSEASLLPSLRSIVIEGTNVKGSISELICSSKQLASIALSGNRLTGSLPSCITELHNLDTLRVSDNELTGTLPALMNQMTSLKILDLSSNKIKGNLPHDLGNLSSHLEETDLTRNYLSCELPNSVLDWTKSPNFKYVELLSGNLFACPDKPLDISSFAYSMPRHNGLYRAAPDAVGSYRCGGSSYVFSTVAVGVIAIPIVLLLFMKKAYEWKCLKRSKKNGYESYQEEKSKKTIKNQHQEADDNNELDDALLDSMSFDEDVIDRVSGTGTAALSSSVFRDTIAITNFSPVLIDLREWQLGEAKRNMNKLAVCVFGVGLLGGGMSLLFAIKSAPSLYKCSYADSYTIGRKDGDDFGFCINLGITVAVGLVFGLLFSWSRGLAKFGVCAPPPPPPLPDNGGDSEDVLKRTASNGSSSYTGSVLDLDLDSGVHGVSFADEYELFGDVELDEVAVSQHINNRLITNKIQFITHSPFRRLRDIVIQILVLIATSIGPNIGYVFVVTNTTINTADKDIAVIGITVLKVLLSISIVSTVSRRLVDIVFPKKQLKRFQLRLTISVFLAALTTIIIPICVVVITEDSCLYYWFWPQKQETNNILVTVCHGTNAQGSCSDYDYDYVESTYQPKVDFSGSRCGSAVVGIYAPIFISVVWISATLPACLDLLIIPSLAPHCFKHRKQNSISNLIFNFLLNVSNHTLSCCCFNHHGEVQSDWVKPFKINVDRLAQKTVQRCFEQLTITLLVALTFGLAAPFCGFACACAALIQIYHHSLVFDQVVHLAKQCEPSISNTTIRLTTATATSGGGGELSSKKLPPDLDGCVAVPWGIGMIELFTCLFVWGGACYIYLDVVPMVEGVAIISGCFVMFYLICCLVGWVLSVGLLSKDKRSEQRPMQRDGGGSSFTSQDSLVFDEAFLAQQEVETLSGSQQPSSSTTFFSAPPRTSF